MTDEKLITKIKELEQQLSDALDAQQVAEDSRIRALADLENFRRREMASRATWTENAVADWVRNLLPNLLELQLGAEHCSDVDTAGVIGKFLDGLRTAGLEKIAPEVGSEIDPEQHEVVMTAEGEPGTIGQVLEPGWRLEAQVLRPAKISGVPHN